MVGIFSYINRNSEMTQNSGNSCKVRFLSLVIFRQYAFFCHVSRKDYLETTFCLLIGQKVVMNFLVAQIHRVYINALVIVSVATTYSQTSTADNPHSLHLMMNMFMNMS